MEYSMNIIIHEIHARVLILELYTILLANNQGIIRFDYAGEQVNNWEGKKY